MATKINGRQIDITKAGLTGSNSTLLTDISAGITLTGSVFLLANPTESLQAATKQYVDSVAGGGVTVNQIAFGNSDSSGVSSDGGLIYSPNHDILGVSGSIEFGGVTGNSIHGDATTGLNLSGTLVNVTSAAAMVVASTTFDVNASGAVTIDSSAGTIGVGVDDVDQNINVGTSGERTITIGQDASTKVDVNAAAIELDSAGTVVLDSTTSTVIGATTTMDLDSAGIMSLNSSAAAINIGNDAVGQALNLGTGGARAIRMGNALATTVGLTGAAVDLTGGTSAEVTDGTATLSLTSGAAALSSATTVTLDGSGVMSLNSSAAAINIGNDDVDAAINIGTAGERTISVGTGAFAADINIGNETGATALDLDAGTGGVTIDAQGAGTIALGAEADTGAINIGGAGVRTITVGNDASTKVDVNALAIELDSAGSIVLDSVTSTTATATTTMGFMAGTGLSLQAVDGGITMTGGAGDQVSVVLGAAAGAETFAVIDSAAQTQFSVGSAGAVSFGDGAWDYSSTSVIAEPTFGYFTSSVLHSNIGPDHPAPGVAPNGIHGAFSSSLGASGEFFSISPAVYLNGLRIRSGTTAQVSAGTRDYYSLKVTSGSVNYLVVSMSSVPVTGDVIMCDFRRSS